MSRLALPAALLVLLIALPSCGGGSGPPAPPSTPLAGPDVRLGSDPAGSELSLIPDVCCDAERVYVVWYDRRAGNMDVYFNRSRDGGRTWLTSDLRLDSGAPGAATSLVPRICCAGESVYVAWYDDRNGASDVYFNRSLDGGLTWLPSDLRVSGGAAGAFESREPHICCAGSSVYVVWHDERNGDWDVYFNRSLDGGATWMAADTRLDRADPALLAETPSICCSASSVYVAWRDERDGGSSVYFNRSLDAGSGWLLDDIRLDDDLLSPGFADVPRAACSGANVFVVWPDTRDLGADIRLNASVDGGLTWLPADVRMDTDLAGSANSNSPDLCAAGDAVFVVWADGRNGAGDVYFNRSLDAGQSWLMDDLPVSPRPPGDSVSRAPRVCCDGSDVHVVWEDDLNGAFDILAASSADGGTAWTAADLRLDTDPAGAAHSLAPVACCAGPRLRAVWYDLRDGPGDVYVNSADFTGFR